MKLQKETRGAGEARSHGRWYDDACGTAFALEVVGERWSLLIVRELMLGGRRFSDLRAGLPRISAKVLTERLEGLIKSGVVRRTGQSVPVPSLYELTTWGYQAEPLMQELGRWAARSPAHDPTLPLSPVSLMLSLRTMLDPGHVRAANATIGFDIAGDCFWAEFANGELPIRRASRAELAAAQAVFHAPVAPVLAALFYGGKTQAELEKDAGLAITGDREVAERFMNLFALPPPTPTEP